MDAGDLIYVVIILIGLISGFLKKRKKNSTPSNKPKSNLEELLQEFVGQEPQPEIRTEPEPVYTPPIVQTKSPHIDDLEHSKKTTSQIIKEHKENFAKTKDNTSDSPESDIDLRQAIIYNTILNRPDY